MSLRPRDQSLSRLSRAQSRMAPGGRRWSESPIPRPGGVRRARSLTLPPTGIPASVQDWDSATPPYDLWVIEWNNNLPDDITATQTGYIALTLDDVSAATSIVLDVTTITSDNSGSHTITGGPFATGQKVVTGLLTLDQLVGFTSGDVYIDAADGFTTSAAIFYINAG